MIYRDADKNEWICFTEGGQCCTHNYIDASGIIRKGAISARKGEICIIPLNMKDGILVGIGKGNPDYLYSAPHGAGRIMSRKKAKECVSVKQMTESMEGIYTSCINGNTVDESVFAYKNAEAIKEAIEPTVEVVAQLRPIWNFKDKGGKA